MNGDLKKIGDLLDQKFKIALDPLNKRLERVEDKIDALTADVMNLQDTAKAVWDKFSLVQDEHKRDIDEIKEHIGLPTHNN